MRRNGVGPVAEGVEPVTPQGLCMTCDHAATCVFVANATGPIWHCGEFDDRGSGDPEPRFSLPGAREKAGAAAPDVENTSLLGLCANCENANFCSLRVPGRPVWHCEEYL